MSRNLHAARDLIVCCHCLQTGVATYKRWVVQCESEYDDKSGRDKEPETAKGERRLETKHVVHDKRNDLGEAMRQRRLSELTCAKQLSERDVKAYMCEKTTNLILGRATTMAGPLDARVRPVAHLDLSSRCLWNLRCWNLAWQSAYILRPLGCVGHGVWLLGLKQSAGKKNENRIESAPEPPWAFPQLAGSHPVDEAGLRNHVVVLSD